MKRIRILAAAAALREFTIAELSAYSGANVNTVRSIVNREKERFEEVGEREDQAMGRPAKRYRVRNVEDIRTELEQLEAEVDDVEVAAIEGEAESEEDRLAAVVVAEDALLRSLRSDHLEERQVLAETAQRSALQGLGDLETAAMVEESLIRRAKGIGGVARLAASDAGGGSLDEADFRAAATALGALAETAPGENVDEVLSGLIAIAVRHGELPPVGVVLDQDLTPRDAVPDFAEKEWIYRVVGETGRRIWLQSWAEDLLSHRLVAGLIVHDHDFDEETLGEAISQVSHWHRPTAVISSGEGSRASSIAIRGALFIPSPGNRGVVMGALLNASGSTNISWIEKRRLEKTERLVPRKESVVRHS